MPNRVLKLENNIFSYGSWIETTPLFFLFAEIKVFRWQNISLSGIPYIMFFGGLSSRRKIIVLC
jgi:hypothetical protein